MARSHNFQDISSQRFGKLIVLQLDHVRNNNPMWLCQCDCGNQKIVNGNYLKTGDTTSCGCAKRIDITGKRCNMLIAIKYSHSVNSHTYWNCLCDCGNETTVRVNALNRKSVQSCGCLKRKLASERITKMNHNNIRSGADNPNWNPKLTSQERQQMREGRRINAKFQKWSRDIKENNNWKCQRCKSSKNLESHHILPWKTHPKRRYYKNNGICLCRECHKEFHKQYGPTPENGRKLINQFIISNHEQ